MSRFSAGLAAGTLAVALAIVVESWLFPEHDAVRLEIARDAPTTYATTDLTRLPRSPTPSHPRAPQRRPNKHPSRTGDAP